MRSHLPLLFFFLLAGKLFSQPNEWTWMKGDNVPGQSGNFGTLGVPAAGNKPGARYEACQWKDLAGNFWLYGGGTGNTRHSDLWKFDPGSNNWTWMHGSQLMNQNAIYGIQGIPDPANTPGGKGFGATTWIDLAGNLWLFGGDDGVNGAYNTLWKYSIATNEWTWVKGDTVASSLPVYGSQGVPSALNTPGARCETSCTWTDNNGELWLFGGTPNGPGASCNDLWKYAIATNEWTWMKGDNMPNQPGVYGIKGIADPANKPGGRWCYTSWKDDTGNLWLFGGIDATSIIGMSFFNDLWKFETATNQWTWMSGSNGVNQPGIYGSKCQSSTITSPGARGETRACWKDGCGNLWLLGGRDINFDLYNDLWRYDLNLNRWFWVSGGNVPNQSSVFGTILVPSPLNVPCARMGAVSWVLNNQLWLFGGYDYAGNEWNDLWRFAVIDSTCGACNIAPIALFSAPNNICPGTCTDFTNLSTGALSFLWSFQGGLPNTSADVNPSNICYNTPGNYLVSLIATNSFTSDTLSLNNYITVYPYPAPQGISQSGDTLFANAGAVAYQWYHDGLPVAGATNYFFIAPESGDYNVVATDLNGCEVEAAIFDVIAGIEPIYICSDWILYPNPVDEMLMIVNMNRSEWNKPEVSVYNLVGEVILPAIEIGESSRTVIKIDCRKFAPGIYCVDILTSGKRFTARFNKK